MRAPSFSKTQSPYFQQCGSPLSFDFLLSLGLELPNTFPPPQEWASSVWGVGGSDLHGYIYSRFSISLIFIMESFIFLTGSSNLQILNLSSFFYFYFLRREGKISYLYSGSSSAISDYRFCFSTSFLIPPTVFHLSKISWNLCFLVFSVFCYCLVHLDVTYLMDICWGKKRNPGEIYLFNLNFKITFVTWKNLFLCWVEEYFMILVLQLGHCILTVYNDYLILVNWLFLACDIFTYYYMW